MDRPPEVRDMLNNSEHALVTFARIERAGARYVWEVNPGPMLERALNTVDMVLANAPELAFVDDVLDLRHALSDALGKCARIRAEWEPLPVSQAARVA